MCLYAGDSFVLDEIDKQQAVVLSSLEASLSCDPSGTGNFLGTLFCRFSVRPRNSGDSQNDLRW